jgi:ATP-binding cassette subfamily F protein uup
MSLISVQEISLAFGGPLVFDRLSMQLEPGERVALLGRNGAGKTTLMKVIAQELPPDSGSVVVQKGAQVSRLPQEVPLIYPVTCSMWSCRGWVSARGCLAIISM